MREGQFLFHGLPRDSASAAVMAIAKTRQRWSCHTDLFYEYMPYLFNGSVTCPPTLLKTPPKKYVNIKGKVSKDKWQSMFRYLAKYVKTLFSGFFHDRMTEGTEVE